MNEFALSLKTPADFLKYLKEQDIKFVDFNLTDMRGKWHHMTMHASALDKGSLDTGICFDGSSIDGWKDINQSDLILKPDVQSAVYDPFAAQKTLKVFCDVYDPITKAAYSHDPRRIAKAAESYLKKSKIADTAYFGPEPEFFIFDDVKINTENHHISHKVDGEEGPYNKGRDYPTGNMGHRPSANGGYFPETPVDGLSDIRAEMLTVLESMGIEVEKHHHEVAPSQCELGIKFSTLLNSADRVQMYKHVVHNVAHSYGKTATFMAKPLYGDNGSGMHVHQSLWKSGKPLFAGKAYADLSENALYYIGGILKHAKALNAFTNPTTNSYKRIGVTGFEAPSLLGYSALNRSAACRIPHSSSPSPAARRIEIRFPDPTANPYLAFAAMLMAGLDGVENKIHPGESSDINLYELSEDECGKYQRLSKSLDESLASLQNDHEFLLKGNVFNEDMIKSYISLKQQEILRLKTTPHPVEFDMYYSS